MKISKDTALYLSFAQNPGTTGSTLYNHFFKNHEINALYIPRYAVSPKEVSQTIKSLSISGASISSPLKQSIIPYLNELSDEAKTVGSVNTIVNSNGVLKGYNTDAWGIWKCLESLNLKNVFIYGTGGVIPSVVWALKKKDLHSNHIFLSGRDPQKVKTTARSLGISEFSQAQDIQKFDLIINATPISLDLLPEIKKLRHETGKEFQLSITAMGKHAGFISGDEMYQHVFQKQFEIYTGVKIPLEEITSTLFS